MQLNNQHREKIIGGYCLVFYALLLYKWYNGMLLYQLQPNVYNTRPDVTTWIFMQGHLHLLLLHSPVARILFDAFFYSMPLFYWLAFKRKPHLAVMVALLMLFVNFVYVQCYTLFPANSIESYTAWLLFPLLFLTVQLRLFYIVFHALRYFLLYIFTSAAIWKVVQGGLFNLEQMSGVLLFQHKDYLASSPDYWFSHLIYWLVNHTSVSYCLYLAATFLEIFFVIGFYTKKADRFLLVSLVLFMLMDLFIMRIPYWELMPFGLTLVFSGYTIPDETVATNARNITIDK